MTARRINRLSAEAIHDIDDVKAWARDQEIRLDSRIEQLQAAIVELREGVKQNAEDGTRNLRLLLIAAIGFGTILGIVVLLSGIVHIARAVF